MLLNRYSMTMLTGTEEMVNAYGVKSIPTLVVIDKNGIIQHEEVGFSPTMAEKLEKWTGELAK